MAAHSLALLGLAWAASALAAPFTPASDSEVVQPLPMRWSAAAREQRARLARNPQQLPLALATAQAAILRGRSSGDPRELGLAQAALAPWWTQPAPPPPVRLLRATVLQSQHHFAPALADWMAKLENGPGFVVVRGLDLEGWTEREAGLVYYALGRFDDLVLAVARDPESEFAGAVPTAFLDTVRARTGGVTAQ